MEERRPDLVFLDLSMPEMDGAQVLAAMRARPELVDLPVVIVSAHDQFAPDLPLVGALSVVAPGGFALEELLAAVEGVLGALDPARGLRRAPRSGHMPRKSVKSVKTSRIG